MAEHAKPINAPYDGDLRRTLLDAAIRSVADHDPANLSLRAVARQVGVSHAAPKHHFDDKTALLTAIAVEGFVGLGEALADAADDAPGPVDGLIAAGQAYVRFSVEHPGHFRVMWRNDLLDQSDAHLEAAARETFGVLSGMVVAAQATGWADGHDVAELATLLWSAVHGLAQLYLDGPLGDMIGTDVDHLSETTVKLLIDGHR